MRLTARSARMERAVRAGRETQNHDCCIRHLACRANQIERIEMSKISKRQGRMDRVQRKERVRNDAIQIATASGRFFKITKSAHAAGKFMIVMYYLSLLGVLASAAILVFDHKSYLEIITHMELTFFIPATLAMAVSTICAFMAIGDVQVNTDVWSATPFKSMQKFLAAYDNVSSNYFRIILFIGSCVATAAVKHAFW